MFGRFDDEEDVGREYLIIQPGAPLPGGTIEVCSTPLEVRNIIEGEVLARHYKGNQENYAIFELVEFVSVWDDKKDGAICIFSEDEMEKDDDVL